MKLISFLCTIFCFLHLSKGVDRVALVIGNGAYHHVSKLPNATSDAVSMAKLLKGAGFDLVISDGGNTDGIRDAGTKAFFGGLERFKSAAAGAKVAVVYYAGHGMEVGGKNYLLPVDASLGSADDLQMQAVTLGDVLAAMKHANATAKMVILDCCRNDPLTQNWLATHSGANGFKEIMDESLSHDTMVMFSTSPGKTALDGTGKHSPFTKALLANLAQPGISAFEAFTNVSDAVTAETNNAQVPWIKFVGTGRAFRLLSLVGSKLAISPVQEISQPSAHFRALTPDEKQKFESFEPGADAYFRTNIKLGGNITGICGDLTTRAAYSVVWQDECKIEWKDLQKGRVGIGSSLKSQDNEGIVFDYDKSSSPGDKWGRWFTAEKAENAGRIFTVLREGLPMPFFTTQKRGISVDWVKPSASLQAPCWALTYSGKFHNYKSMDALQSRHDEETVQDFKFVLFVFAKE